MSKRIASFPDFSFAGLAVSQLRDHGLSPLDVDNASHISVAGADQFYYVEVNETEIDQAQKVLIELGHEKWLM